MSDLISKHLALNCKPEFLSENLSKDYSYNLGWNKAITEWYRAIREIKTEDMPSADRPTGTWLDSEEHETFCNVEACETGTPKKYKFPVCSECGTQFGTLAYKYKYCPECGAKMEVEDDDR